MIAEELINHMIPPLKPADTVDKAIHWMEEFRVTQLPVVDEKAYKGIITEEIILHKNSLGFLVSDFQLIAGETTVGAHQHFYDVIKAATDNHLESIAVLDDESNYLGIVSVKDTVAAFAQTIAVQSQGGILVISLNESDYSLAEISRLVESNNAKILCSYVTSDLLDISKVKLTIKVNRLDLTHIIATLERFDYKIIAKFQEAEYVSTDKDRLDLLLKYLSL